MERYYQKEIECASREQILAWQDERLVRQVRHVWDNVPYYRAKMEAAHVAPDDIKGRDDLYKLPFLSKADLREAYPFGLLAEPLEKCIRIHSTSGTTGKRVVAFYTKEDIDLWNDCCARALAAAGAGPEDVCQVAYGYGLFTGGFAAAAGLYLFLLHGAPGVLLAALAAVCALLFLLRRPILRRAAVCVLGLLAGFAWCRGYEALFLRPFADLSGETAAFSAQALAAPQESSYGQSVSARLTLDGKSCTAVIYFDEADGEILPGSLLSGTAKFTTAQEKHLRGKDYDLSRGVFLTAGCRETLHAEPGRASVWLAPALFAERLRAAIQSAFPSDTAGFVQALLLGDKTGLRYEDQNDLAIAGIYHAVAVSGMHVSILLGMILLLCGGNHRLAAALGLPAAVFFIVMTGAPTSAVRAGVMQALVLCAPLVRRENDPPTTICAAVSYTHLTLPTIA